MRLHIRLFALVLCMSQVVAVAAEKPNILVIVADDLGYTDVGAFGGEISTPNIDALASDGTLLTNFHAAPACAPSRSMLLTGTDHHIAGLGAQPGLLSPEQRGSKHYQGKLLPEVPTLMEQLKAAGYRTLASAKWHLGGQAPHTPKARGFDRSFVLVQGAGGHFDDTSALEFHPRSFWLEDDKPFTLPQEFYSSDFMTDKMLEYLDEDPSDAPWFAYLGYTAPHWPLQAPAESIQKYESQYLDGWDVLRGQRLRGAISAGAVPRGTPAIETEPFTRPWSSLKPEDQRLQARRMQVYAAMIDRMDQNIGRILDALEERGDAENTIVLFLSDNGAASEQMESANPAHQQWLEKNFDNSFDSIGSRRSYVSLGHSWARALTAPFRDSKSKLAEGGGRVPAIMRLPQGLQSERESRQQDDSYQHIIDLAPTFLELAGAKPLPSMRGTSLLPQWLDGEESYNEKTIVAAELFGRRMAQRGSWKALHQSPPWGPGEWQLFNLAKDLGEQTDLSADYPDLLAELIDAYERYADEVGVIELTTAVPF